MTRMWWIYIVVVALLALGTCGFTQMTDPQPRQLTRMAPRTARSMYDDCADSPGAQRR